MNITNDELKYINGYIDEIVSVTGKRSEHISKTGKQNLNGVQALAYGRIRYTAGGDYKRTERMRDVLTALVDKVKGFDMSQLNKLVDTILPRVYTNITASDVFSMLPTIPSIKISESIGWPYETRGITLDRWYGIPITLESNVIRLHKEVLAENNYAPSEVVQTISNDIVMKTGYNQ